MLSVRATRNTADGTRRLNPSERSSAVAQTASSTPDRTSTSQDTTPPQAPSCRCPGTAPLVRGPGWRPTPWSQTRLRPSARGGPGGDRGVVAVEQHGGDAVVGQQGSGDGVRAGPAELVVEVTGRQQVGREHHPLGAGG